MLSVAGRRCLSLSRSRVPGLRTYFPSHRALAGPRIIPRPALCPRPVGRRFCSNRPIPPSAPPANIFHRIWQYKLGRLMIKSAGVYLGMFLGAAIVAPDPRKVLEAALRFLISVGVTSVIALDYKYSLRGIEDEEEYAEALRGVHARSADKLLALFQYNRGIFIKFGQHLAALDYLLPEEYTSRMKVLQNHAPDVKFEALEQIFLETYGKKAGEVFDDFDENPIAAASIAQVHTATLNGQKVAVKVQFPGLRETCAGDSFTIQVILGAMTQIFPEFKFGWLIKEMNLNLPKELNFVQEGINADVVRHNFAGYKKVKVPEILWDYSTDRILVMEFCEGNHIDAVDRIRDAGIRPSEVAMEVTNIFDKMAFEDGFVHCDPHPGNLLVRPCEDAGMEDGRMRRFLRWIGWDKSVPFQVVLLDHGLYRSLEEDNFKQDYLQLWNALINFDEKRIEEISERMGAAAGYRIFCSILTAKSWTDISDPEGKLNSSADQEELDKIAKHARKFLKEIMYTLQSVKPELLLLFKTNDLLRAIHRRLGSGVNTYMITSKNVDRLISKHYLEENPGVWPRIKTSCHRAIFLTKISVFEWYMYFTK